MGNEPTREPLWRRACLHLESLMGKLGEPLTPTQTLGLSGALAVWFEKAAEEGRGRVRPPRVSGPPTVGGPPELIEARKALRCLYLAAEESVARDVGAKVEAAFAALLALPVVPPSAKFDTPPGFIDWFAKNYAGEVIFSDPAWHARNIFRTAVWHYRALPVGVEPLLP